MASSGHANYLSRKRIIDNVEECKSGRTPEAPGEEEMWDDDARRILSQPVKAKAKINRRKKPQGSSTTQLGLLSAIVIGGIAVIIGLRYLAEMFGFNWIGG